MLMYNFDL